MSWNHEEEKSRSDLSVEEDQTKQDLEAHKLKKVLSKQERTISKLESLIDQKDGVIADLKSQLKTSDDLLNECMEAMAKTMVETESS